MTGRTGAKNRSLWVASAGLLIASAVLAAGAALQPSAESPAAPARPSDPPPAGSAITPAPPPPGDLPARLFAARVSAFARVQAVVWRAFGGEALVLAPRRAAALRVAPAATAQGCLAQAVYYEARGEPAAGQAAVAQVVLNRTHARGRPGSVCGVVFEGAARRGCQFSFACDPRLARRRVEPEAWRRAQTVAQAALTGPGAPELQGAVNYHADYVHPSWAARFARTAAIGRHIFYAAADALAPPAEPRPAAGE